MLTTTYKIISKILVERFKPIVPKIVNQQQIDFVHGRCITDNLLAFKLGQENVVATLQDIIFMKLNFEKRFDQVDHNYLWATLSTMDLDPLVISLLQGLISNVDAKFHVNGLFTQSFLVERGVRQGDPMSPLLFALSYEPMMCLLKDRLSKGDLVGLKISTNKSLVYQLFANDVGLFLHNSQQEFENARATIQILKNILGAFLNMAKSVILLLCVPMIQAWFYSISRCILQPHETTTYLGCLIGFKVTPMLETDFLLKKVCKCLNHWENCALSFTGRVVLLKHVIQAMRVYHLMSMSLNSQSFEDLDYWLGFPLGKE